MVCLYSMLNISSIIFRFVFIYLLLFTAVSISSQAQQKDSLPVVGLQEIVVSALRLPANESNIPFSISILSPIQNTQGLSLAENIAGLPGLTVNARYNFAVGDRITNRGFGARTQF